MGVRSGVDFLPLLQEEEGEEVNRHRDGRWVFLECNPSGMYGFVEIQVGLPITEAFADHLCEPVIGNRG